MIEGHVAAPGSWVGRNAWERANLSTDFVTDNRITHEETPSELLGRQRVAHNARPREAAQKGEPVQQSRANGMGGWFGGTA